MLAEIDDAKVGDFSCFIESQSESKEMISTRNMRTSWNVVVIGKYLMLLLRFVSLEGATVQRLASGVQGASGRDYEVLGGQTINIYFI